MFVAARATPSHRRGWGVGGVGRICRCEGIGGRASTGRAQASMAGCAGIGNMAGCAGMIGRLRRHREHGRLRRHRELGRLRRHRELGRLRRRMDGRLRRRMDGRLRRRIGYTAKIAVPCINCRQGLPVGWCQTRDLVIRGMRGCEGLPLFDMLPIGDNRCFLTLRKTLGLFSFYNRGL